MTSNATDASASGHFPIKLCCCVRSNQSQQQDVRRYTQRKDVTRVCISICQSKSAGLLVPQQASNLGDFKAHDCQQMCEIESARKLEAWHVAMICQQAGPGCTWMHRMLLMSSGNLPLCDTPSLPDLNYSILIPFANFSGHASVQNRNASPVLREGLSCHATAQQFLFQVMHVQRSLQ